MGTQTVFSRHVEEDLRGLLAFLESKRVLLLTEPSRRFVDRVGPLLETYALFDEVRVHVPEATVAAASAKLRDVRPDTIITLGGGSATGLGKALRLEHSEVSFLAIPTTYAGSEQTSIYGIKRGHDKHTGRDERVRPDAILYSTEFTMLPERMTAQSLLNAMAHPVSALWESARGGEMNSALRERALAAVRQTLLALEALAKAPRSASGRELALRATASTGSIIEEGELGPHHHVAHFFGGRFDLEHSALHSLLLPHTLAYLHENFSSLFGELEKATACPDLPGVTFDLLRRSGAKTTLIELGVEPGAAEEALAERAELPQSSYRTRTEGRPPA
ncbi:MAG: iron-containing alcohol dehydrogenase, partial [Myxococcota bacterium]